MGRFDRRAKEGPLSDVARIIRDQEFESDKELDRLIKKLLSSDDLMKATPQSALEVAQSVMYEAWEAEGYCYASSFKAAWKKVAGALEWLKAETGKPVSSETRILH